MKFAHLANRGIQDLQPYQPGKARTAVSRELGLTEIDKLASNENMLGPSPLAISAVSQALSECNYYPDGTGHDLRQALSHKLHVAPENIILGNGSDNILSLIVRCFAKPDSDIIYSEYGFSTYAIIAKGHHAQPRAIASQQYGHDLTAMAAACRDNTNIIFIANPNNPTGTYNTFDELVSLLKQVPTHTLVVVDEAYFEYINAADYPDTIKLQQDFPNLITIRTFSKAYGLAGFRVGYGVCHPDICDLLNRIRLPFNVNSLALIAATAALNDDAHLQATLHMNQQGKAQLLQGFAELNLEVIPSVTNFLTVNFQQDAMPIYQALLERGVIVRPLLPYNMPKHLRITIGTAKQNQRLLDALRDILQHI